MPDSLRHRGRHPTDEKLFAAPRRPTLARAVDDLSLLLARGYAEAAAARLVGDHFQLDERQRKAVERSSCADGQARERQARLVDAVSIAGTLHRYRWLQRVDHHGVRPVGGISVPRARRRAT